GPKADSKRAVAHEERHEHVEHADLRGGVEQERDDVRERGRNDDPRRPVMKRTDRAVRREEAEELRARRYPGEDGDAERGIRGEPARTSELPEEEIHLRALGLVMAVRVVVRTLDESDVVLCGAVVVVGVV